MDPAAVARQRAIEAAQAISQNLERQRRAREQRGSWDQRRPQPCQSAQPSQSAQPRPFHKAEPSRSAQSAQQRPFHKAEPFRSAQQLNNAPQQPRRRPAERRYAEPSLAPAPESRQAQVVAFAPPPEDKPPRMEVVEEGEVAPTDAVLNDDDDDASEDRAGRERGETSEGNLGRPDKGLEEASRDGAEPALLETAEQVSRNAGEEEEEEAIVVESADNLGEEEDNGKLAAEGRPVADDDCAATPIAQEEEQLAANLAATSRVTVPETEVVEKVEAPDRSEAEAPVVEEPPVVDERAPPRRSDYDPIFSSSSSSEEEEDQEERDGVGEARAETNDDAPPQEEQEAPLEEEEDYIEEAMAGAARHVEATTAEPLTREEDDDKATEPHRHDEGEGPRGAAFDDGLFDLDDGSGWDELELFGDDSAFHLVDDEVAVVPKTLTAKDEVAAALEALEAPALTATLCVGTEERRTLIAAVSTVFSALVGGGTDDATQERLGRALSRGTQSRDRIVATAARAARLKIHTKKRQRPATTTADVPEDGLRAELERARTELADVRRKLALEADQRAKLQRSLRASFTKAQRDWQKERDALQDAANAAKRQALHWQQRAQTAARAADLEQRKAQRRLADHRAQHRATISRHVGKEAASPKRTKAATKAPGTPKAAAAPATTTTTTTRKKKRDDDKDDGPKAPKRRSTASILTACSRAVAARVTAREGGAS